MKRFSGILDGVVLMKRPEYERVIIDDVDYIKELIEEGDGTYTIEGIQLNDNFIPIDEEIVLEIIKNQ